MSCGTIFVMMSFAGKYRSLQKSSHAFYASSRRFRVMTFKVFDLQKVGHSHGVLFSQCCPSMIDITIYKSRPDIFVLALMVSEISIFRIFEHQKVGQCHGLYFRNFDGKYQNL